METSMITDYSVHLQYLSSILSISRKKYTRHLKEKKHITLYYNRNTVKFLHLFEKYSESLVAFFKV